MNARLLKQWKVTADLLASAASEIEATPFYGEYSGFFEHNELELALDVLVAAGDETNVTREFWWNLKKAAEVMGLQARHAALRAKVRQAGGSDV